MPLVKPSLNVHSSENACLGKDQVDLRSQCTCYVLGIVYSTLCNPQTRIMRYSEKCGNGNKGLVILRHFSTVNLEVASWNQSKGRPDHVTHDFPPHQSSSKSLQPSPLPRSRAVAWARSLPLCAIDLLKKEILKITLKASPVPTLFNFTLFYIRAPSIWPLIIKMFNNIHKPCLG